MGEIITMVCLSVAVIENNSVFPTDKLQHIIHNKLTSFHCIKSSLNLTVKSKEENTNMSKN